MAFSFEVKGAVHTVSKLVRTPLVQIGGIGTGLAYAAGDAFGTMFEVPVPLAGTIGTAIFIDKDDEGIETDLVIFDAPFDQTADNAAFTVSDADMEKLIGTMTFATFKNFAVNQTSTASGMALDYIAPLRKLYIQAVTRGAPNIAAGSLPLIRLIIEEKLE